MPSTLGRSPFPSVAGVLAHRFPETATLDPHGAAGLVHRLDTGTSGLLMAARNADTYAQLRAAFRAKRIVKHYLAIVHGHVTAPVTVDQPLRRSRRRMRAAGPDQPQAWPATTRVQPLAGLPTLTLVHLQMRTGVTHQLRAHLAQLGHPVLGDDRYGDPARSVAASVPWHYLHAAAVQLEEPDLPRRLHTAPPHHWLPLLRTLDWSPTLVDPARIATIP
jgi:23S rRNA pseudouridine1911/1915/1917 synthase